MTPRFLTNRKGLNPQSLFLAVFFVSLTLAVLSLLLQPGSELQGQEPPAELPVVTLLSAKPSSINEGGLLKVELGISEELTEDDDNDDDSLCHQETTLACVEGGILIFDSYNEKEGEDPFRTADELVAFVFSPNPPNGVGRALE